MNLMGEPAFVGRHCGGNDYTIDEQTVRFYEDALDDRHPLHERFAPPLLHHSECYKHLGQWYLANLFGNLHGQQDWSLFAPIPIGARVRTRSTIVDRYSRRGRDWVVNETDLMSAEPGDQGRLFVRGRTYQSFLPAEKERGEGFVVDQGTAKQKPARPPFPTATGPDLAPPICDDLAPPGSTIAAPGGRPIGSASIFHRRGRRSPHLAGHAGVAGAGPTGRRGRPRRRRGDRRRRAGRPRVGRT